MSPQDFGPEQLKQTIFDILNGSTGYDVFLYYTQIRHNGENDFLLQLYKEDTQIDEEVLYNIRTNNLTNSTHRDYDGYTTQELSNYLDDAFMQSSNIRIEQHNQDDQLINIVYPFDDKRKNEEPENYSKKRRTVFGKKSKNCLKHLNCDIIYLNGI